MGGSRDVGATYTPEGIVKVKESYTEQHLKSMLARKSAPACRLDGGESPGANKNLKKQAAG